MASKAIKQAANKVVTTYPALCVVSWPIEKYWFGLGKFCSVWHAFFSCTTGTWVGCELQFHSMTLDSSGFIGEHCRDGQSQDCSSMGWQNHQQTPLTHKNWTLRQFYKEINLPPKHTGNCKRLKGWWPHCQQTAYAWRARKTKFMAKMWKQEKETSDKTEVERFGQNPIHIFLTHLFHCAG